MPTTTYTLEVQDALEERQIRRLGAAVCLIWASLPNHLRGQLLDVAAQIAISGEDIDTRELRAKLAGFVEAGLVNQSRT